MNSKINFGVVVFPGSNCDFDAYWKGDVGASEALANKIRAVPGVAALSTLRYAHTRMPARAGSGLPDSTVSLLGIDPAAYCSVSSKVAFSNGKRLLRSPM